MKIFLPVILILSAGLQFSYGNFGGGGVNYVMAITGPTSATIGQTTNYTVSWIQNGYSVSPPPQVDNYWTTTLGNFTTTSSTGASITWTSSGKGVISFDFESWDNYYHDSHVVTVSSGSSAPLIPATTFSTNYSCGSTLLTRNTNPPTGVTWYWQTSSSGTSTSLGSGTAINRTATGNVYLRARQSASPYTWSTASQSVGRVTVYTTGPANPIVANNANRNGAGAITISVGAVSGATSYKWYAAGGTLIAGQTTATYAIPSLYTTTTYNVSAMNPGCESSGTMAVTATINPVAPDENYVMTNTVLVARQTEITVKDLQIDQGKRSQAYQYFDGLGRPMQSVITMGSPNTKKDIVQPIAYDEFGRETTKYLPYVSSHGNGWFKDNFVDKDHPSYGTSDQAKFYQGLTAPNIAIDTKPFAETFFEPSLLNRPEKQYGAGQAWRPTIEGGSNKYIGMEYLINQHGTTGSTEQVIAWDINSSNMPVRHTAVVGYVETNGYYSTGQQYVNVTKDEQGNAVREYTNKSGQVILKKVQSETTAQANLNSTTGWALTYYIYDDFGNLRFVLQPELSKKIHSGSDSYLVSTTDLANFAFQYKYDGRRRMVEKQVPGADVVYMVYDGRDRLVLTQDGNQRSGTTKYWTFTKYDVLNRPILTGIYTSSKAPAAMQIDANSYFATHPYFETYSATGIIHGYSNVSFPNVADPNLYLTVAYYDNYAFKGDLSWSGFNYFNDNLSVTFNQYPYSQPAANDRVLGQVTGTKTKILDGGIVGGSNWLKSVVYYDDKYRPVQAIAENHKGGQDRTSTLYDFVGKVLSTKSTQQTNSPSGAQEVYRRYTYDHAGRPISIFHTIAGGTEPSSTPQSSPVTWGNFFDTSASGAILTKTTTTNAYDASALSQQFISAGQDGWLEFSGYETGKNKMVGLGDPDAGSGYGSIDHAIFLNGTTAYIWESGSNKANLGTFTASSVFRIERKNGVVTYSLNGAANSYKGSSTIALYADCAIYAAGGKVANAVMGTTTVSSPAGQNAVTWGNFLSTSVSGAILTKTTTTNAYDASALSQQFIPAGQDGWLEFSAYETGKNKMVGLGDPDAGYGYGSIDHAIFLNGTTAYIWENGANKNSMGTFTASSVFRIERKNGVVTYSMNGAENSYKGSSTIALYADCAIYAAGGKVANAVMRIGSAGATTPAVEVEIARNEYNELGQLVTKKLHSIDNAAAKQQVDYRYNIRGWLTRINDSNLDNTDTGVRDYFGMNLAYNTDLGTGNSALLQYNGNISATKWSVNAGFGTLKEMAYNYKYDPMNRLQAATHKQATTIGAWTAGQYDESGFTYDLNGNINHLDRKGENGAVIDNLTYNYGTVPSNKLLYVQDNAPTASKDKGFFDGNAGTAQDYNYDPNGNMTRDLNKGIGTTLTDATNKITYNYLNLPETVTKGGNSIRYVYDATGRKLSQITSFGTLQKKTDYVGEFIYEDNVLQFVNHEEGRIVMSSETLLYTTSCDNAADMTAVNATLTAYQKNDEKYVKVTPSGTVVKTGAYPIGGTFTVASGERYKVRAKGYHTGSNNAYLYIKAGSTQLGWPGAAMGKDENNASWIEQVVTIPAGAITLQAGVAFNTVASGDVIYLNEFTIEKLSSQTAEYQYHLKDHLGNVRLTFTTKADVDAQTATLETGSISKESAQFLRYANARKVQSFLFDHTNGNKPSTTTGFAQRLSGGANEKYGLARSLSVMPGDKIDMEVFAKYIDPSKANLTAALNTLIMQIAAGSATAGTVIDGGGYSTSTTSFPFPTTFPRRAAAIHPAALAQDQRFS